MCKPYKYNLLGANSLRWAYASTYSRLALKLRGLCAYLCRIFCLPMFICSAIRNLRRNRANIDPTKGMGSTRMRTNDFWKAVEAL